MKRFLYSFVLVALAGCASSGPIEILTEGLGSNQIATLNPAPMPASVIMSIDGRRPENCFTNCSFYRPVRIPAGKHKVKLDLYLPGLASDESMPSIPTDRVAEAQKTKLTLGSLFVSTFYIDEQEFTFDAEKSYQLRYGYISKDREPYLWWEVTEPR
ncbi:hypothetical protein NU688_25295 [Variovorax sp. ZS18.2.2]|uniref:hypothetical protein n=1 Tax=Variovorax sp. ZS18.2.2 TaxID=2971255 RepID=UPI0021514B35|nr:hypothetical protein [Variovorax sp. ZS18.2.2]MCR6479499.1 hypothetical protein [Variovorax sp. ZS18.2.2]